MGKQAMQEQLLAMMRKLMDSIAADEQTAVVPPDVDAAGDDDHTSPAVSLLLKSALSKGPAKAVNKDEDTLSVMLDSDSDSDKDEEEDKVPMETKAQGAARKLQVVRNAAMVYVEEHFPDVQYKYRWGCAQHMAASMLNDTTLMVVPAMVMGGQWMNLAHPEVEGGVFPNTALGQTEKDRALAYAAKAPQREQRKKAQKQLRSDKKKAKKAAANAAV